LLSKRVDRSASDTPLKPENAINTAETATPSEHATEPDPIGKTPKDDLADSDLRLATGPIRSRADAYRQLEGIANFLQSIEPHSPTPYLIRRAVSWGRMPLPELMQEVLREEGDLNRLFTVLGLAPQNST
jgi:type VI secretion system protein ImpA